MNRNFRLYCSQTVACWLSVLALASSCSGPGSSEEDALPVTFRVRGSVQKGPFVAGSVVRVVYLRAESEASPEAFETVTTSEVGDFSLELPASGTLLLTATGRFYDETLGRLSDGPITLRAYRELSETETSVHVNVVTDLTFDRVSRLTSKGLGFAAATRQAERELVHALGLGGQDFVPRVLGTQMNILGGPTEENAYLLALDAVLTKAAALRNASGNEALQGMMRDIAADLSDDSALDDKWKTELKNAAGQVDAHQVTPDLAAYLKRLGVSVGLPHLDHVLNPNRGHAKTETHGCLLSYIDPKLCEQATANGKTLDSDVAQQLRAFDKKVLTQLQAFEKEIEPYPQADALQVDVWGPYPRGVAFIADPDAYQVRVISTTDVDYPVLFPYTCRDDVIRHWRSVPVNLTNMMFVATELVVGRSFFGKKKTRLQYQGVVTLDLPDGRRLDHRQYKVVIFTHRGCGGTFGGRSARQCGRKLSSAARTPYSCWA